MAPTEDQMRAAEDRREATRLAALQMEELRKNVQDGNRELRFLRSRIKKEIKGLRVEFKQVSDEAREALLTANRELTAELAKGNKRLMQLLVVMGLAFSSQPIINSPFFKALVEAGLKKLVGG